MAFKITATTLFAVFLAYAAEAEGGIDFASMPLGCSWVTQYSNGNVWRETYFAKEPNAYITSIREEQNKNPVSQIRFSLDGHMTQRNWANGQWETFAPFSCFNQVGSCRSRFRNSDGDDFTILNRTQVSGDTYSVTARVQNGDTFPPEGYRIGPFGMSIQNWSTNYSSQVTKFENCALPGS